MSIYAWELMKEFRFEASHLLPHHDGKCARLHGHSWVGRVYVRGSELIQEGPKTGMVRDYADISAPVKAMVEQHLDHRHLNILLSNPTSELVAQWVFQYLSPQIPGLVAVEIEETCTSRCRYGSGSL